MWLVLHSHTNTQLHLTDCKQRCGFRWLVWKCFMLRLAFSLVVLHDIERARTLCAIFIVSQTVFCFSLAQFLLCAFAREQTSFEIFGNMYCLQHSAKRAAFNRNWIEKHRNKKQRGRGCLVIVKPRVWSSLQQRLTKGNVVIEAANSHETHQREFCVPEMVIIWTPAWTIKLPLSDSRNSWT